MKKLHLVITGGHHNSALVVARLLVTKGHRVTWLGHRYTTSNDTHDSAEYLEVTASGIPFHELKAGKFGVGFSLSRLINIPLGFLRAHTLLKSLRPDAVLSFGSYLGMTTTLAASALRIPVFLHEQTVVAGKANKITALVARRVYLTWESSKRYFPAHKSLVVGLPLRAGILKPTKLKLFPNSLPTILILGGKQGSHQLNQLIFNNLPALLTSYNLVHQTGTSTVTGDYLTAITLKDSLKPELASRYRPEGYIGESEIGSLLVSCDLYLGRSGAHITYELGLLATPAVLIPYLHTHSREQLKNAKLLEKHGLAIILPQNKLSYSTLTSNLTSQLSNPKASSLPLPRDASDQLVKDLLHATTL